MLNQRGQEFTVFRFLIEAIMAIFILLIIISAIRHFEERKIEISQKRLFEGFSSAFESPNGDVVERADLAFKENYIITSGALAKSVRMPEECVSLLAHASSAISTPDSQTIKINQGITISVYSRCKKPQASSCEIECEVSFAEPFK